MKNQPTTTSHDDWTEEEEGFWRHCFAAVTLTKIEKEASGTGQEYYLLSHWNQCFTGTEKDVLASAARWVKNPGSR